MTEVEQGTFFSLSVFAVLIYSTLWWIGGRPNGRFWRRWIAPLFFGIALITIAVLKSSFTWWMLLLPIGYKAVTHFGYGDNQDEVDNKIMRRIIWSLIYCLPSVILVIPASSYLVFGVQVGISIIASTLFGTFNPFKSSPTEEGVIVFSSSFLIPFMI